ncbi:MAG: hypothetical protein WC867_07835 [Candidatus Pacearchaeota archaeon]|jgi:hypothetical protein
MIKDKTFEKSYCMGCDPQKRLFNYIANKKINYSINCENHLLKMKIDLGKIIENREISLNKYKKLVLINETTSKNLISLVLIYNSVYLFNS